MPDLYEAVRVLPLQRVLAFLGFAQEWKPAKGGNEQRSKTSIQPTPNRHIALSHDYFTLIVAFWAAVSCTATCTR